MKHTVLKSAALAAMIAASASCTNETIVVQENHNRLELGQGEDVVRIKLSNTTATRAARPIGSSTPDNNVNRIFFKFMKSDQTLEESATLDCVIDPVTLKTDDDFYIDNNVLVLPNGYDGSEICIKFSNLTKGEYRIIACGYNYTEDSSDSSADFPYSISPKGADYLLKCESVDVVQEIFAGANTGKLLVSVNEHGKFAEPPVIQLQRQVAGLLAYFQNIPVFVNNEVVDKITVSSKAVVTGFYIPVAGSEYNGIETVDWVADHWVDYLTFEMNHATNYQDTAWLSSDACYEFDNDYGKFQMAEGMTEIDGLVCDEGTLFGSCFLLAHPRYEDFSVNSPKCATLNICYWNTKGELILSVPLRNGGDEKPLDSTEQYHYGILNNNFYSIGKKTDLSGDGDEPLDIDEPTGYDYAEVSISDSWEQTHDLFN